jgi:hypothetical protein
MIRLDSECPWMSMTKIFVAMVIAFALTTAMAVATVIVHID